MKIFVTGTRGLPDIAGGIEKHCQNIYPLMAQKGHEIYVATRKPYIKHHFRRWRGVRLVPLYAPHKSALETIVHTFLALIKARLYHPDLLHIHAIGPGLLTPLARLMGMKVVITHHGPDYERIKWGRFAKILLQLGEKLSVKWAHGIIAVSPYIQAIIQKTYGRRPIVIYNGVRMPDPGEPAALPEGLAFRSGSYVLAVSRIEPGKGLEVLVKAFSRLKTDYRLVIAGYTTYESAFSRQLQEMINLDERIVRTSLTTEQDLRALYANAGMFVQPSFHEGLPISLLEAMSYGLSVLASDIPAHKAINLPEHRYFKCGNEKDLQHRLEMLLGKGLGSAEKDRMQQEIIEKYNWDKIAEQTLAVYRNVLKE